MSLDINEVHKGSILFFWFPVFAMTREVIRAEDQERRKMREEMGRYFNWDRHGVLVKVLSKAVAPPPIGWVIWGDDRWNNPYEIREETLRQRGAMSRLELTSFEDFPPYKVRCPACDSTPSRETGVCPCGFMQRDRREDDESR